MIAHKPSLAFVFGVKFDVFFFLKGAGGKLQK